eukprot:m.239841 g.239841  ORF g.239841 m.239841 type:complete len:83 (+) comp54384_c0_seq1:759-1007(+)
MTRLVQALPLLLPLPLLLLSQPRASSRAIQTRPNGLTCTLQFVNCVPFGDRKTLKLLPPPFSSLVCRAPSSCLSVLLSFVSS